jgi:hypothetical protein
MSANLVAPPRESEHESAQKSPSLSSLSDLAQQTENAPSAAHLVSLTAELHELRAQLEQIRAERNRLAETQRHLMELLHVQSPEKLVHDVRNVLNERELLKALVAEM